jgi:hypothetical protein
MANDEALEWFSDPIPEELPIAQQLQNEIVGAMKTVTDINAEMVASLTLLAVARLEKLIRFGDSN